MPTKLAPSGFDAPARNASPTTVVLKEAGGGTLTATSVPISQSSCGRTQTPKKSSGSRRR